MNQGEPTAGREANGRLLPGHGLGGRPRRRRNVNPVVQALEAAGSSVEEARAILAKQTLEAAKAGDPQALGRLDKWTMPKERPLDPGLLRGVRTAEQVQAAMLGAMAAGAATPGEAEVGSRVGERFGEAGQWERLREIHEASAAGGGRQGAILPASPDDGPDREGK